MSKRSRRVPAKNPRQQLMQVDQQKLINLEITKLKGITDLCLDFSQSSLTAIMGGNCAGKTTVLHALACAYRQPQGNDYEYTFPQFFKPNPDALWRGSDYSISYAQRVDQTYRDSETIRFTKANDRWAPRYYKRPIRHTRFVSIGESVPDLDVVNLKQMVHYSKKESTDQISAQIRDAAGQIMKRCYEKLFAVTYTHRTRRSVGVQTPSLTYSGLSMSSGEQRVFKILDAVYRAPKYGLVLIDELDLFLHQDALMLLLRNVHNHCDHFKKQLIFTTHFPPVASLYEDIGVYTLGEARGKTIAFKGYSYEAIRQITGAIERPISCYVEDDVAEQIVSQVAVSLGIRKYVQIGHYGAANNAFSLGVGLYLSHNPANNTVVIQDGDVYADDNERRDCINRALSGTGDLHSKQRDDVLSMFRSLLPKACGFNDFVSPEFTLHDMIVGLSDEDVPKDRVELHQIAIAIRFASDKHEDVNRMIGDSGESRQVALSKIVELAARSSKWELYTKEIREWLASKKHELALDH
jgi:ABC-type lipoprotein export system ATPase subunit